MAIGDGPEEEKAAAEMGWPFVKVSPTPMSQRYHLDKSVSSSGHRIHDLEAPWLIQLIMDPKH